MPASADTVLRLLNRMHLPDQSDPRVVGVDDWIKRRGRSYGTIVVDLERRGVVDLLPNRTAVTLAAWLRQRPGIEVVARDRSTEYASGIAIGAPKAIQVADRWHLLANLRQAVERWLAGAHGRLRRLPPLPDEGGAVPARRIRGFPRSAADAQVGTDSRVRRLGLHDEAHRRHVAGEPLISIARAMNLARGTVRNYARASSFPERGARRPSRSALDRHLPHLQARVAEGGENAAALWRELQAQGFTGTARQVRRWMSERRRSRPGRRHRAAAGRHRPTQAHPTAAQSRRCRPPGNSRGCSCNLPQRCRLPTLRRSDEWSRTRTLPLSRNLPARSQPLRARATPTVRPTPLQPVLNWMPGLSKPVGAACRRWNVRGRAEERRRRDTRRSHHALEQRPDRRAGQPTETGQAPDAWSRQLRPAPTRRSACGMIHAKCRRTTKYRGNFRLSGGIPLMRAV